MFSAKHLLKYASLLFLTLLLVSGSLPVLAQGDDGNEQPIPPGAAVLPMTTDCSTLTPQQLEVAYELGICMPIEPGGVFTDDIRTGNCGSTWMFVSDPGLGGIAQFEVGAASSQGTIFSVDYVIYWVNERTEVQGSIPDADLVGSTMWTATRIDTTGWGNVRGTLTGTAYLTGGIPCTFLNPTDTRYIGQ